MQCNWGILGPGYVATRAVIPAIQQVPDAHVLAVASSNKERAQAASTQFGICAADGSSHVSISPAHDPLETHALYQ